MDGNKTYAETTGIGYYWPHLTVNREIEYKELKSKVTRLFEKDGPNIRFPDYLRNIECIWGKFSTQELLDEIAFGQDDIDAIMQFRPSIYFAYMYSTKVWSQLNEEIDIRKGQTFISPGIQNCANNMPQGEIVQIPLVRNVGRQNQILLLAHFDNGEPDLGRKGFQTEVTNLSKTIGRRVIEDLVNKYKDQLRVTTGVRPDLKREGDVSNWKKQIELHEERRPIKLSNEHFFKPVNDVSITSEPTREQDVIALFNQLIAGGVIRGVQIMSTNERFTYDGMYRVYFRKPDKNHQYHEEINPLGVDDETVKEYSDWRSEPKILEYKYCLDGLIEDIGNGTKNSNDISLVVVWEMGTDYQGHFDVTSLLLKENLSERMYHGITHTLTNLASSQREMDLIVLKDLVNFLNNPEEERENQIKIYSNN